MTTWVIALKPKTKNTFLVTVMKPGRKPLFCGEHTGDIHAVLIGLSKYELAPGDFIKTPEGDFVFQNPKKALPCN